MVLVFAGKVVREFDPLHGSMQAVKSYILGAIDEG